MRILDLQRRLREVGRIRIGEQVPTGNGRSRPKKLEVFRLTSRDRAAIDAAADRFGGQAEPWDTPDGQQWQVKTEAAEMPVVVPPGDMAFSQAYEVWSAGGCKVRCDGRWDFQGDKACHCDPTARACDIHTRLSVMLPDLPGLGTWRLDTQGYYAAVELGGVVDLAASYSERGQMLPARLRLEQRSVKRVKPNGQPETRRFAVPVLDLDVHPLALTGLQPAGALEAGPGAGARFEPVPAELPTGPETTVAEQVQALDAPAPRPRRNAAAPIPATGTAPRTAEDVARQEPIRPPEIIPRPSQPPAGERVKETDAEVLRRAQGIAMRARDLGIDHHLVVQAVTAGRESSSKQISRAEADSVLRALVDLDRGRVVLETSGEVPQLVDAPADAPLDETAGDLDVGDCDTWDGETWKAWLATMRAKVVPTLREAKRLAGDMGVDEPTSLADLQGSTLAPLVAAWVEENAR